MHDTRYIRIAPNTMKKHISFFCLIAFLLNCSSPKSYTDKGVYFEAGKDGNYTFDPAEFPCWKWGLVASDNTLDDTIKVGSFHVPPGVNGRLYQLDCAEELNVKMSVPIRSYKAKKGHVYLKFMRGAF